MTNILTREDFETDNPDLVDGVLEFISDIPLEDLELIELVVRVEAHERRKTAKAVA